MTDETKQQQVDKVMALLSTYAGRSLGDSPETRGLAFNEIGMSSLTMASAVVELEERLDRQFDFRAFAGVKNVGDLLRAIGLS
ncbi:MAG: acyl carrier protein [Deltaproteobacteria bacterium]|nr:acyl carrier protein [Deltaproteobacteria bacterium]